MASMTEYQGFGDKCNERKSKGFAGWLWKKNNVGWEKVWCTTTTKRISLYTTNKEDKVIEAFDLHLATLHEVALPSASERHSRGITLWREASPHPDSPRGVADLGSGSDDHPLAAPEELTLAAGTVSEHLACLDFLSRSCSFTARIDGLQPIEYVASSSIHRRPQRVYAMPLGRAVRGVRPSAMPYRKYWADKATI